MPGARGPVPVPLQTSSGDLTKQILEALDQQQTYITSKQFPERPQNEIKAALDRLSSRQMVQYDTAEVDHVSLTAEGKTICDEGSHEYKVWDAVRKAGKLDMKDLQVS